MHDGGLGQSKDHLTLASRSYRASMGLNAPQDVPGDVHEAQLELWIEYQ